MRVGKTAKDHANHAHARAENNRLARVVWQKSNGRTKEPFPCSSCNGKRNRVRWTGKGGVTINLCEQKRKK